MNNILLSFEITVVGMGLVFSAIIVLWGLMSLLTALIQDKGPASNTPEPAPVIENRLKAQAAVVAVAVALAEQETSRAHPLLLPPTSIVSAWQLGMRTRQMYEKSKLR